MKKYVKRIISLSLSVLIVVLSLNISLIATADNGVATYLGNQISLKDTFEYNGLKLDDIWETTLYNGENNDKEASTSYIKTNAEVVADPENSANKVLKLGTVSNEKGAVGLFFKSTYIPNNRKIKSFSFDIYLENTTKPTYITYYKGAKLDDSSVALSNAVGLTPVHAEGGHQICANGATCKYWAKNLPVSYGTWFNVKLTYVYQDGRLYGFKLKLGENAEQSFTYKKNAYTPLDCMMESGFTYGFTFGKSASLIDNVTFNYEVLPGDSAELVAGDFRVTFAKVLAISESATTASDKAAVEEALAAFDGLRDDVKALLEAEKAKLDALLSKIKADIVNTEVSTFRTAHSDILAKTKDTATTADITALNAAVNALLDLSIDAQKALETEKTNLFEISRKLKGSSIDAQILTGKKGEFFDDFEYENGIITSDIYETLVFSPKDNKRENNTSLKGNRVASPTENSNNVLLLDAADEANAYIYTLNSNYYPLDRQIESISLKYYTAEGSNMTRNVGLVVYSGETNDGNINLVNYGFRSGQNTALVLNGSVVAWTKAEHALPTSAWTDIKVDFIYKNGKLWGFTLALDAGNGPISNTYEYGTFSNALGKLKEDGFKVGLSFGIGETAFVDDIRFSFSKTAQELAAEQAAAFRSAHAGILGKTAATVTNADKAAFDAAFDAYGKLSVGAQGLLTAEFALLGEMTKKFYPNEYAAMQKFISDYEELLSREDNAYTKEDLPDLKAAYDAYEALGEREQILTAYPYKAKIDSALRYINDNPQDVGNIGDYENGYEIFADFEYNQNPFVHILENKGQASGKIVADPQNPDNNVFAMELISGNSTAIWQLNEKLWPEGSAQVTKFSFKFLSDDVNNFVTPFFIYDYTDSENFDAISYQGGVAGKHGTLQKRELVDGVASLIYIKGDIVVFGEWLEMQFTFSGTSCQVLLSSSDGTTVSKLDFTAGSKVGFGFISNNYMVSMPVYVDDVTLQFEEGDFDLNEENYEIYPYYQGNTFQNPDETVLITGDSYFGNNVESAQLYTIPDTAIDATNPQYIFETRFNKSAINAGVVTEPSAASWDTDNASEIEFVQKTKTSVKFVLPQADKKSVYAVKLKASNKEVDPEGNRLYEDKIIYINNPYITYTLGDDGSVSTNGGWLRIQGENLYIDDAHTVTVVAKSVDTGVITPLSVTKVTEGDAYSVEVAIPETMAEGKYEVYLHNGYGDNTCWSAPVVFTVGKSARSIWRAKGTFNVKDYGAKGDDTANDTGAIIRAIDAAVKNGGGVVYFPKGKYRVISTLVVPQNVSLEGEDLSNTMIFWTAYTWQYGEANKLFSISGNCEIRNLNIYATRAPEFVYFNSDKENQLINNIYGDVTDRKKDNVYLENLQFDAVPISGQPGSGGGHAWAVVDGADRTSIKNTIVKESGTTKILMKAGGRNYQFENIDIYVKTTDKGSDVYGIFIDGYDVNIENFSSDVYSLKGKVRNAIIENCDIKYAGTGIDGTNMYLGRNSFQKHYQNNRELWVSDGVPYYKNVRIQFTGAREDIVGVGNTDEITYKLLGYSEFDENALVGMDVFVADGQGYGQMRVITSSKPDGTFTVDQPFTIAPNRNSAVWIYWPRTTNYFIQNSFIEGSGGGPYGTSIDSVWDGNTFSYHNGQLFTNGSTVIWYTSILNEVYRNPLYIHGEGYGGIVAGDQTDCKIYFNMQVAPLAASFMGTVIKNNDFDEWYIHIKCAMNEVCRDFIVEHNKMAGAPYGIKHDASDSYKFDGMYIRNNDFDTTGQVYSDVLINSKDNKLGYKRCIIITAGESVFILGDVNLDGKVTLKDSTIIRYYYVKMIELTEEQLLRADANADGKVNLKDSTRIRQHLANRVPLGTVTDPDDSSSDNSSGSDSNSGGSSSSGGSGESSDSSGGSEESSSSSSSGGWLPGIW
ncbi:MAG: DUF4469 domain-containing protein [Clostridia bacterium]|nr:DUF4469 domain-containing protein [Clostridia bacterium]